MDELRRLVERELAHRLLEAGDVGLAGRGVGLHRRLELRAGSNVQDCCVLHGFPGDELQFFSSKTPNAAYEPFAKFLLREMSRAAAVTYEEFTGDWAGATFSSSKMGVTTNWPRILYRRRNIVSPLAQMLYEAWLEEDIELGGTPFPDGIDGFLANRESACQAFWRGPSMPQADELKTAMAAQIMCEIGLPKSIAYRPFGIDPDDAADERARERDYEQDLDLEPGTVFGQSTNRDAAMQLVKDKPAGGADEEDDDEFEDETDDQDENDTGAGDKGEGETGGGDDGRS